MAFSRFVFQTALFFILGLALSSFGLFPGVMVVFGMVAGLLIAIFDQRSVLAFGLIGLALGAGYFNYRFEQRVFLTERWAEENKVVLVGTISEMSEIRASGVGLTLRVDWPVSARSEKLKGKIFIFGGHHLADRGIGDQIVVSGRLASGDNDYWGWRLKEGLHGSIFHPEIESVGFNFLYSINRAISQIRRKAGELADLRLAEPQSSLLKAMIFGWQPADSVLTDQLTRTGLSHVAVVSGMNLVILVGLVLGLSEKREWRPTYTAGLAGLVILLFVLMTGGHPSIYRAGIMSGLGLIGLWLGRLSRPERSLVWAALVLLLANPFLLRWDIGFQLSFLAVLGLVYLLPWLKKLFDLFWPDSLGRELFLVTIAAQIATWPVAAYYFGQFSLIGPLANVAVVGFLPAIFILGLAFFLLAGLMPISLLLGLVLTGIVRIIWLLSEINWAVAAFQVSGLFLMIYYLIGLLIIIFLKKRNPSFHAPGLC